MSSLSTQKIIELRHDEKYYREKLAEGLEFQDFVCRELFKHSSIIIQNTVSRRYQLEVGENFQGYEIKYDARMKNTGNLYFETHESAKDCPGLVESGILRSDHHHYCIGDYEQLFIFDSNRLRNIYRGQQGFLRKWPGRARFSVRTTPPGYSHPSSQGFTIQTSLILEQLLYNQHIQFKKPVAYHGPQREVP